MDFDAITMDTNTLEGQNFNLENGLLARFEQFSKTKDIIFVMSEIVLKEMISHMEEGTKASISKYKDALKTGLFYRIDDDITEEKIKNVKKIDVKSIVEKRIKRYVNKTGLQIIPTDGIDGYKSHHLHNRKQCNRADSALSENRSTLSGKKYLLYCRRSAGLRYFADKFKKR